MGVTEKIGGMLLLGRKKVILEKNQGLQQGRREVEVGTLFLSNDENNVIAENVSYF